MESVDKAVRRLIKTVRDSRGLKQAELARDVTELGVTMHQTTISKIEDGQRKVGVDELLAIAAALEVPPVVLMIPFDREDDYPVTPGYGRYPWYVYQWFIGAHGLGAGRFHPGWTPVDYYTYVRDAQQKLKAVDIDEQRVELIEDTEQRERAEARLTHQWRDALQLFANAVWDMEGAGWPCDGLWDVPGRWRAAMDEHGIEAQPPRERRWRNLMMPARIDEREDH